MSSLVTNSAKWKNRKKQQQKIARSLLKESPFFNFIGNLALYRGKFNNSLLVNSLLKEM